MVNSDEAVNSDEVVNALVDDVVVTMQWRTNCKPAMRVLSRRAMASATASSTSASVTSASVALLRRGVVLVLTSAACRRDV